MKKLLLLLSLIVVTTAFSKTKVEITKENGDQMTVIFETEVEADEYIQENKKSYRWGESSTAVKSETNETFIF